VTVRVADGKPSEELQVDSGALGWMVEGDRRQRVWALVFTGVVSATSTSGRPTARPWPT
jgi:hypothetical protein